jgi:hypothetical protein
MNVATGWNFVVDVFITFLSDISTTVPGCKYLRFNVALIVLLGSGLSISQIEAMDMAEAHEVHSECPPSFWLITKLSGWFTFQIHSLIDLAVTSIQLGDACHQIEMNPSKKLNQ